VSQHVRLGYAATGHGYQSDTVTIGVELVDGATTRRGFYVGVTRGCEENWIHVITDSRDVAEARDILEQRLAVDRVDIGRHPTPAPRAPDAVTSRGALSHPGVVDSVRADVAAELDTARIAQERTLQRRQPLVDAVTVAQHVFADADRACRPFQDRLDLANAAVAAAWQQLHDARIDVEDAKFGHRHGARATLAIAEQKLTDANTTLADAEAAAGGPIAAREQARRQLADSSRALRRCDRIDHWATMGQDTRTLGNLADALDTWHTWAKGDHVHGDQVAEVISVLNEHSDSLGSARLNQLARPMTQWAVNHAISREPVRPLPPVPEIDIGIDL
jgi:hypothetical protein